MCNLLYRIEDQLLEDVSDQRPWMRKGVVMARVFFIE